MWVTLIFAVCLLPGDALPGTSLLSRIPHFDKIVHFSMYFVFTLFLLAGFTRQYGKTSFKAYFFGFLIAFCCGVAIELLQSSVGRSCNIRDAVANTVGMLIAMSLYRPVKWMLYNIL